VAARRPWVYRKRVLVALFLLLIAGVNFVRVVIWCALFSYSEMREALALRTLYLQQMGTPIRVEPLSLLVAFVVALGGFSVGALLLIRSANRNFDRAIGRPVRVAQLLEPGTRAELLSPPRAGLASVALV
jgi:hypothetical protein